MIHEDIASLIILLAILALLAYPIYFDYAKAEDGRFQDETPMDNAFADGPPDEAVLLGDPWVPPTTVAEGLAQVVTGPSTIGIDTAAQQDAWLMGILAWLGANESLQNVTENRTMIA